MAIHYQPGDYMGIVEDQAWQQTKKGDPMLVLRCRIVASLITDTSGQEQAYDVGSNYTRTVRVPFIADNQQNLDLALDKLRFGAGWEGDDFADLRLAEKDVRLVCKHGQYQNKPTEEWDLQLPRRSGAPLENDPNVPRTLNALFGRKLKQGAQAAAKAPPPAVEHPVAAGSFDEDDDIPFFCPRHLAGPIDGAW